MKHRRRLMLVLVLILTTVGAVVFAILANNSGGSVAGESGLRVSAKGQRVPLLRRVSPRAAQADSTSQDGFAYLLAERAGLAFYRVGAQEGNCYAVGDANSVGLLSGVACSDGTAPVMDYSVYEISKSDPGVIHVERVAGFAADAAASIGFTDANGQVVNRVSVQGNVYAAETPPTAPVAGIEAFDSSGKVIYTRYFPAGS